MDFHLSPYAHHQPAFITQPSIKSKCPHISIWRSLRHRDGRPCQAQSHPQVAKVLTITLVYLSDYLTWAVPHHGTSYCPLAYTYSTHCVIPAYIKWYHHCSHHSYWPTISSMFMTPETISFGRGHLGSWEGNMLYQGRRMGWWPLLAHLLNGLHRSQVLNLSQLRSSDRP